MVWYCYIATILILAQGLYGIQMYRNYLYVLSKYKKKRPLYQPQTVLIVPCKGLEPAFQNNIASFFAQDYDNYLLWFVVADKSDPAYDELCKLKNQLSQNSKAVDVQVFVAGQGLSCSQKIHNLLYCYKKIGDDIEVLAFADSDICVRKDWLSQLVWPLRKSRHGAASGYRWFIPKKNNTASLALSSINAKIAQCLGNTHFNQAWGGSMAIRADTFRQLGLDKIWPKTLSDDLSLSYAVKKAGKKVAFVPACLVASYEMTSWRKLFEFGRRQLLITRIYSPGTWWFGLLSSSYSVLGLWAGGAVAIYAAAKLTSSSWQLALVYSVPVVFFAGQMSSAILRQKMIRKLLKNDLQKIKAASIADILFFWAWSLLLLSFIVSSAFGRTICWRGIRYKLLSPTQTIVLNEDSQKTECRAQSPECK